MSDYTNIKILSLIIFYWMWKHIKIFWFITFCAKLFRAKPLRIRFDKVDGFIRVYDGTIYSVLFGPGKHHAVYDKIRYLINQKNGITYAISHNFARIEIDSYDSLPLEKTLT